MRTFRSALLLLLLLSPAGAQAVEAVFGLQGLTGYNTNVFSQSENGTKGGSFRGGPILILRDQTGQLNWGLDYRPSYEAFYDVSGINSFYHLAEGSISWRPSSDWDFYLNENFSYRPIRSSAFEPVGDTVLADPGPIFGNDPVLQNYLNLGFRHSWTPRWFTDVSATSSILDYRNDRFSDSSTLGASGFLSYLLTPRDTVGGGVGYTAQTISPPLLDSATTSYYQLFGLWNHDFSPTLRLEANAGPTLVSSPKTLQDQFSGIPEFSTVQLNEQGQTTTYPTDPATCDIRGGIASISSCRGYVLYDTPSLARAQTSSDLGLDSFVTLPLVGPRPEDGGTDLTFFANINLEKEWKNLVTSLGYVRNASTTSGLSQSTITDTLNFRGAWTPSPLWRFTLVAYMALRETNSDQPQYLVVGETVPNLVPCQFLVSSGNSPVLACPQATLPGVRATGVTASVARSNGTNLTNYVVTTQVNRKVTKESYVYARFTWNRQNNRTEFEDLLTDTTFLNTSSTNRYIVAVGFVYEFDPIQFSWD